MEEDKLSRIIKEKLADQAPAYKPEYWEEAAAQMELWEADEKRKKRPFFWLWIVGLLLLGSSAMGAFIWWQGEQGQREADLAQQTPLIQYEEREIPEIKKARPKLTPFVNKLDQTENLPFIEEGSGKQNEKKLASSTPTTLQRPVQASNPPAPSAYVKTSESSTYPKKSSMLQLPALTPLKRRRQSLESGFALLASPFVVATEELSPKASLSLIASHGINGLSTLSNEASPSSRLGDDFVLGAEWQLPLGRKTYLQTGLQFMRMPLANASLLSEARSFSFTFRDEELIWKPVSADLLQLPLGIGRRISARHSIELGLALQYLLGSRGTATTRIQDGFNNQRSINEELSGITYGMRRWGIASQLAYKLHIWNGLYASILYQMDLRDLTRDNFFQDGQRDAYRGLRLGLEYRIR